MQRLEQDTQRCQCVQEYSALSWQKTQKQQWEQLSDVILTTRLSGKAVGRLCIETITVMCPCVLLWPHASPQGSCSNPRAWTLQPDVLVWIPVLQFTSSVTLGLLLKLPVLWSSCLSNGDGDAQPQCWGINECEVLRRNIPSPMQLSVLIVLFTYPEDLAPRTGSQSSRARANTCHLRNIFTPQIWNEPNLSKLIFYQYFFRQSITV